MGLSIPNEFEEISAGVYQHDDRRKITFYDNDRLDEVPVEQRYKVEGVTFCNDPNSELYKNADNGVSRRPSYTFYYFKSQKNGIFVALGDDTNSDFSVWDLSAVSSILNECKLQGIQIPDNSLIPVTPEETSGT